MFWIDFRRDVADMTLEWVNKHAEHEFNVYLGRDPLLKKINGGTNNPKKHSKMPGRMSNHILGHYTGHQCV